MSQTLNRVEAQLRLALVLDFVRRYDRQLDDKELAPNGDDYNRLVAGVRGIIVDATNPHVHLSERGR